MTRVEIAKPSGTTRAWIPVPAVDENWLACNRAHHVSLPGSSGPRIGFLMYPQAETTAGRLDNLDPDNFRYTITAKATAA